MDNWALRYAYAIQPVPDSVRWGAFAERELQIGMAEMLTWDVLSFEQRYKIWLWCFGVNDVRLLQERAR